MANILKQFGDIFETENYFSTIELVEWFWPQKASRSLFECIKKAKEDVNEFDKFIAGVIFGGRQLALYSRQGKFPTFLKWLVTPRRVRLP
jgi:hypothetical protein